MAVRRCKKSDLKRIAKATGATLLSSMANLEGIHITVKEFFEFFSLNTRVFNILFCNRRRKF